MGNLLRVRDAPFPDALAPHKDQRLNQQIAFPGFALHVVNGVPVFDIGVEPKNGHSAAERWEETASLQPKLPLFRLPAGGETSVMHFFL
jgi:hypothetical protein